MQSSHEKMSETKIKKRAQVPKMVFIRVVSKKGQVEKRDTQKDKR